MDPDNWGGGGGGGGIIQPAKPANLTAKCVKLAQAVEICLCYILWVPRMRSYVTFGTYMISQATESNTDAHRMGKLASDREN